MSKGKILVVEDEPDIAELIEYNLLKSGYSVELATSGEEALARARKDAPVLVILDLMLPGVDGLEVCRQLKKDSRMAAVPVIMVTAKSEESDVVAGLELGADDYIAKPFSPKVLLARIKTVLRRGKMTEFPGEEVLHAGVLEVCPGRREVRVMGRQISLTYTEFNILLLFVGRPGWVYSRSQIFHAVRGDRYHVTERSVDVHIRSLRKKLGEGAEYIETVRGVGYRFRDEP